MTPKQRYDALLAGRQPDILPRLPILMQFAAEYIGSNYAAFAQDHRVLVEANLACARDFGIDQVSCISDPWREASAFGAEIEFPTNDSPRCRVHVLEHDRDLGRLPHPDVRRSPRTRDRIEAVKLYRARSGDHYSVLGWVEGPIAAAADLRGVSAFLLDLVDDPEWAEQLMDRVTEVAIEFAVAQIEAGADTVGIGDALASQISPKLYQRFVLPREKRIVDAIHAAGARAKLHICGNITKLLPHIATLGVDVLDVDAMVDIAKARQAVGPKVVLMGGIDPVAVIKDGTPQAIRAELARCCAAALPAYAPGGGCEIPAATPKDNLKALCAELPPPAGSGG
ncbi:MAG: uroporphyrinogen decarboxylase family protein [Planctomycetota bacterium]|nr:uroporphyrinogen decarboxylase family protein [Planctomycetota bacterium]MCX8038956.1 uroporphyrinogen decarboxylase family protein [Planctomycetota bacterium]MDW8372678.1 uroporphyrinogen decarboxylase family protein [Planctomycetota bacterium]